MSTQRRTKQAIDYCINRTPNLKPAGSVYPARHMKATQTPDKLERFDPNETEENSENTPTATPDAETAAEQTAAAE